MELTAVSANLGCGGPHGAEVVDAARKWARATADSATDLLFLQEAPGSIGADLAGYVVHAHAPGSSTHTCRSLVAVRSGADIESERFDLATADYHGSYLAAARLQLPNGLSIIAVSVHAAPARLEPHYRAAWPGALPAPRPASDGVLWDADLVATTLARVAERHPTLAAGDFNESRDFDDQVGRPWAAEYFAALHRTGLIDSTHSRWDDSERPTRGTFQIDHVLATADIDAMIHDPHVMPAAGSDHAPLAWGIRA